MLIFSASCSAFSTFVPSRKQHHVHRNTSCSGCFFLNGHRADYSPERGSIRRKAEGSNHPTLTQLRSHLSGSGCHSWGRVSSRRALSALTEPRVLSGPRGVKEEATAHFLLRTFSLQAWAKGKYRLLKRLVISIRAFFAFTATWSSLPVFFFSSSSAEAPC